MLLNLFTADNIMLELLSILIALPALLFSLSAHEWAHGFAAYKQGDGFAKASGRLTLNPLKHIDPLGTLLMLLVGFGWAKPVPVVPSNFRNGRKSMMIVSIAGILTNLILATVSIFLLYFIQLLIFPNIPWLYSSDAGINLYIVLIQVLTHLVIININLAVFNLVPIPPLDGYKLFKEIFIGRISYTFFTNIERYSNMILLIFLIFSDRIGLIGFMSSSVFDLMTMVMNLIFNAYV